MITNFQVGDKVTVNYPEHNQHGMTGEIIAVRAKVFKKFQLVDEPFPIKVVFNGDVYERGFKLEWLIHE